MTTLDDKLREIITDYLLRSYMPGDTEKLLLQIKQAFADEGYIQSPLVEYQFKRIKDGVLMTGQAWYDRFYENLPPEGKAMVYVDGQKPNNWRISWNAVDLAAKRAAGINS